MASPTVLCVQDDRQTYRIHEQALQEIGCKVISANDGEEALAMITNEQPDFVLLDVLLPKRDGFAVLEAIRDLSGQVASVSVLLLSSCRVSPEYRTRADELGAVDIVAKPIALDALCEHVAAATKSNATQDHGQANTRRTSQGYSGLLQEVDFGSLIHRLHGARTSGVLLVESNKKKKAVEFRDGYPIAIKSNLVSECLGNFLVGRGVLGEADVKASIERVRRGEGLQGEILVAMDLLDESSLGEALSDQARNKLHEIFSWRTGRFEIQMNKRLKRGSAQALEGSPANMILDGCRLHTSLRKIDRFIDHNAGGFLARGNSPFYQFQSIALSADERALLARIEGGTRLGDIAHESEASRRVVYGLLMTEILELQSTPSVPIAREDAQPPVVEPGNESEVRAELTRLAREMRGQTYFEMLGIPTTATAEAIGEAFEKMAVRCHPDRYQNASGAVRQVADEVYRLVSSAYETLSDPARREVYVRELAQNVDAEKSSNRGRKALAAETVFQMGEVALRARDYEGALVHFGRALEEFPEEGEYHAHYGWCLHLCNPDNEVIIREAIEHVTRGVKLARDREKPYLFLGRLYKVIGRSSQAEKMFARAVQIRPDCVDALRELRLMNMRRDKKGILGRLLRR